MDTEKIISLLILVGGCVLIAFADVGLPNRVIEGEKAVLGEFPFMVALYNGNNVTRWPDFQCQGVLITNQWGLTSASCIDYWSFGIEHAGVAGILVAKEPDVTKINATQYRLPAAVFKHPSYDYEKHINDIALFKFEHPYAFTDSIQPAKLPMGPMVDIPSGTECTVVGWGYTEWGEFSKGLLKADVTTVSDKECKEYYYELDIIPSMICAGKVLKENKNACKYDLGAPLLCNNGVVHGIAMNFPLCYRVPIYTQVSYFTEWIASIIEANSP